MTNTPTAPTSGVRNALATRAEAGVVQSEQGMSTAQMVTAAINRQADAFRAVLPEHVDHERFARLVLTAVKATPKLMECFGTQQGEISVLLSAMQAAALGLEPNTPTQEAWLLPRNVKNAQGQWVAECELSIGYRGYMKLARRTGTITSIFAEVVRAKDRFEFSRGLYTDHMVHEVYDGPDAGDDEQNPLVKCYAVARFTNGHAECRVTGRAEVLRRRAMSTSWSNEKSRPYSPWTKWTEAMWRKTAVRALIPYLDLSAEIMEAHTMDERPIGYDAVNGALRVIETSELAGEIGSGGDAPATEPPLSLVEPVAADPPDSGTQYVDAVVVADAEEDPHELAERADVRPGKALLEARKIAERLGVDPPNELGEVKGTEVGRQLAEWFRSQTPATAGVDETEAQDGDDTADSDAITDHTRKKLFAMFGEIVGGNEDDQRTKMLGLAWYLGETNLTSRTQIGEQLAQEMIMALDGMKATGNEIIRKADGTWDIQARPVSSPAKKAARATKKAAASAASTTDEEPF